MATRCCTASGTANSNADSDILAVINGFAATDATHTTDDFDGNLVTTVEASTAPTTSPSPAAPPAGARTLVARVDRIWQALSTHNRHPPDGAMAPEQAEVLAAHAGLLTDRLATADEMRALDKGVTDLREEMHSEIGKLREEMQREIGLLREEMHREIGLLREETKKEFATLQPRSARTWRRFEARSMPASPIASWRPSLSSAR